MKKAFLIGALALGAALTFSACKKAEAPAAQAPVAKVYQGTGVVQLFQAEGRVIVLKHDKIDGLMDAMTMGFELKDPAQGKALKVGDKVAFTLTIVEDVPQITQIDKAAK